MKPGNVVHFRKNIFCMLRLKHCTHLLERVEERFSMALGIHFVLINRKYPNFLRYIFCVSR